jgi:RND family efflux transporter MFP subunit
VNANSLKSLIPILLILSACHPGGSEAPEAARDDLEQALEPRQVRLVTPEVRKQQPTVTLVGEVRAFDTVTVASEVAGRVEEVFVEVGDRVGAGDPLAQIDREAFQLRREQAEAELAAAQADLALAERELERKQDLRSDNTIPQAALDQAQATHDLAAARVKAAEATLSLEKRDFEKSIVRAPSAGAVSYRHAVAGQWADVGTPIVRLALGDRVKIAARVPSQWVTYLQGLEGFEFTVRAGEPARSAKLYAIDPVVNDASRSFEVIGTAAGTGLKPGLYATITLTSPESLTSLWLPASAVVASDTPRVYTVADGRVEVRRVQTGDRDDGMVEIVSGLDPEEAVIRDVAGLSRGLPVTVTEDP